MLSPLATSAPDRLRGAQEALSSRRQAEADAADARAQVAALEQDRATLQGLLELDRDGRFIQASGLYHVGQDKRFEAAVIENKTDRSPAWWKVSGTCLAVGVGGALLLSAVPGMAPTVPGLLGAFGLFGALVGPSNARSWEQTHFRPRRVDRMLTETLRRELDGSEPKISAARTRLQAAEARLARPDLEVAQEVATRSQPAPQIEETREEIAIGGVRLPRQASTIPPQSPS